MLLRTWELALRYQDGLFAGLFVAAITLVAFGAGTYVAKYRVFPYRLVYEAAASVQEIYKEVTGTTAENRVIRVSEFTGVEAAAKRIEDPNSLTTGLLWPGGEGLFREICPERGCIAVEFSSSGEVVHAYPYRLDELRDWEKMVELPRKTVLPFQTPRPLKTVNAARKYSNGDILVMLNYGNATPQKGAAVRLDRDGMPVWVRDDYSHHWPTVFTRADGEELTLVPGMTVESLPVSTRLRSSPRGTPGRVDCWDGDYNQVDHVKLLDAHGSVLQDIRIVDSIIGSPFVSMLFNSFNRCDLVHLNYIDRIRGDVQGIPGVEPGDYVVSLRNISAFGIMDRETGRMKQLVRGTFSMQHSVQHLEGSHFLLFDNYGAESSAGPSRVLLVDLGGGAVRERMIFPVAETRDEHRLFTRIQGNISISGDRKRILVASFDDGMALEVQLSDGAVINVFRNLHDLSGLKHNHEDAGDRAVYVPFTDLQYVE